ncbi:hypothetical protein BDW72DRAFT_204345 [Aspergillus terricola var. indicus]
MISLSRRASAVVRWPLLLNEKSQRRLFGQIADLGHPFPVPWLHDNLRRSSLKLDCVRRDGVFPVRWILYHTTNMECRNYGSSPGFHIPKITGHRASRLNGSADKLTPIQQWPKNSLVATGDPYLQRQQVTTAPSLNSSPIAAGRGIRMPDGR